MNKSETSNGQCPHKEAAKAWLWETARRFHTSILAVAVSMAADVAAISLSTRSPSSSCLMSRPLGRSSWEQHHKCCNDPLISLFSRGRRQERRALSHNTFLESTKGPPVQALSGTCHCVNPRTSHSTPLLPESHPCLSLQGHSVVAAWILPHSCTIYCICGLGGILF